MKENLIVIWTKNWKKCPEFMDKFHKFLEENKFPADIVNICQGEDYKCHKVGVETTHIKVTPY